MRPEKEMMVQEIHRQIESSRAILVVNYMGLKAAEMEEFRHILRPIASDCMVVKNTLLARALAMANLPAVDEFLVGPTAIIFGKVDDVLLAKRVAQFSKDHESLRVKVGILEEKLMTKEQIAQLALLPSREVLIVQLVGQLKAPLVGLVSVLSALQRGLVIALLEIQKKKEGEEAAKGFSGGTAAQRAAT